MAAYLHRCIVTPAAYAPLARALCDGLAPGGPGSGMLATALSAEGTEPASHYISAGMIEDTFAALLPLGTTPGQPETIVELANGMVTLEQVTALLSAIDVTDEGPFDALDRLGLKLIQEAI